MRKIWLSAVAITLFLWSCQKEGLETIHQPAAENSNFDFQTELTVALDIQFETNGLSLQPMMGTPVDVQIELNGQRVRV